MNILAVDTALSACSVAIVAGDRTCFRSKPMLRGHAEALMPMLEDAMAEAGLSYDEIDRFVATIGPGTFTGVRVGVAAVRGLALATGRPAVGVTTLQALAETARSEFAQPGPLVVAIDARRGEIYAQAFSVGVEAMSAPTVADIGTVLGGVPVDVTHVFGSAAEQVAAAAKEAGRPLAVIGTDGAPDPLAIASVGKSLTVGPLPRPLYLRPADARPQSGALARK